MSEPLDDEARARLRGRRASHGFVIVIAVVFVAASAAQIIPAVFGWGAKPIPPAALGTPERTCADGIRSLSGALDRASAHVHGAPPPEPGGALEGDVALAAFEGALAPDWKASGLEQACSQSASGSGAWAALMRLRHAHEELVLRDLGDLSGVRRDVAVRLPP